MLVIGHKGAAGEEPENTVAAINRAINSGADMIEIDVRLTKDNQPVLAHDFHLYHSHRKLDTVRRLSLAELQKTTAGSDRPIVTLERALRICTGKLFIMIELKDRGSGLVVLDLLTKKYRANLDSIMLTSFSSRELIRIRNLNKKIKLGMNMRLNPLAFLAWERKLHLSAVGFHRLHLNKLAVQAAHQLDMFVYVYTVNRKGALTHLIKQGVDGVVTDYPTIFVAARDKLRRKR